MSAIFYSEPELVIALNRKIIFVNPNDLQIFKEVEIPSNLLEHGLKAAVNNDEPTNCDQEKSETSKKPTAPIIQQVALSTDHQLLAVTTAGQKALLIYQCRMEHAKLVSVRSLARTSSALAFSSDGKKLLVADKSGDCYEYDCVDLTAGGRLLFGHLSVLYDVAWSAEGKHILTCDRDDKIRVTNYPETYDIYGYCLGHTEFVSGLALLDVDTLVSVSGDKSLRLWNYKSGNELESVQLPAPAIRLEVCNRDGKFQAAVLLFENGSEIIHLYDISKESSTGIWKIASNPQKISADMEVYNLCFSDDRLFLVGPTNNRLRIKAIALVEDGTGVPANWVEMIEDYFKDDAWNPEDFGSWFKKRYDNVSDYLERKKRRIEKQEKHSS